MAHPSTDAQESLAQEPHLNRKIEILPHPVGRKDRKARSPGKRKTGAIAKRQPKRFGLRAQRTRPLREFFVEGSDLKPVPRQGRPDQRQVCPMLVSFAITSEMLTADIRASPKYGAARSAPGSPFR